MVKLRRIFLLIGWLVVPTSADATTSQANHPRTPKRMRKVLPLDHHHRHPAKYHRLLQNTRPGNGGNGGSNIIDVGSWVESASGDDGHHGRSGRNKGFLGEAVELMKGGVSESRRGASRRGHPPRGNSHRGASRAGDSHPGNSHPGNSHPGNSHPGNKHSHPGSGRGMKTGIPTVSPTIIPTITPTIHPVYYSSSSSSKSKSKSKGKGKGGKGKGKGDSSSSSDDCDSSSSSSEDCNGIIGGPMGRDTMMPTMSQSVMPPAPTVVSLTPFGILFDLEDGVGTPSSEEYGLAIEITVGYLNSYMSLRYEGQGLLDFASQATSTIYREGVPQIDFEAQATFMEGVEPPSVEALDNTVAEAFVGANLALYLNMLNNLPPGNPFSTASGARLTNPAGTARRSSGFIGSVSTVGKAGIAGAIGAGGLILFAIGFLVYDKQQKQVKRKPIMPGIGSSRSPHHQRARSNNDYGSSSNGILNSKVNPNKIGSDESEETNAMFEATTTCSTTVYSESTARSGISKFFPLSESLKRIPSIPMPMSISRKATLDTEKEALEPQQAKDAEIEAEAEDTDTAIATDQHETVVTTHSG